jgi:hypothetical protein
MAVVGGAWIFRRAVGGLTRTHDRPRAGRSLRRRGFYAAHPRPGRESRPVPHGHYRTDDAGLPATTINRLSTASTTATARSGELGPGCFSRRRRRRARRDLRPRHVVRRRAGRHDVEAAAALGRPPTLTRGADPRLLGAPPQIDRGMAPPTCKMLSTAWMMAVKSTSSTSSAWSELG